jgi:hypothetical protein
MAIGHIQDSLHQNTAFRGINAQRLRLFYQQFPEFQVNTVVPERH